MGEAIGQALGRLGLELGHDLAEFDFSDHDLDLLRERMVARAKRS